jgi:type I restriction enzyme S subunit
MARVMRDSGIEWIGKMPATWSISRLKYIGRYINGYAFKPEQWGDKGKLIIRIQDLTGSNDNPNYYDGEIDDKYYIHNGDILVSWAATLDAFIWNKGDGLLNQHIFKAVHNPKYVCYEYFFWLIKVAMEYMNNDNKHGIVMQHVTLDVFGNFAVVLPPIEEQSKISKYLEKECVRIDAVMEQTRASIEEYKKLKQSVITKAVTKGIHPNRPMKDSGIDWISEIPSDWTILRKLSYAANKNISYGIVKLFDPDDEFGVKVLRCSDVREGIIDTTNIRTVTREISNEYNRTILEGGEVLINVRGTLGGCAVVPPEMKGYNIAREVAMVSLSDMLHNRFLMYYFLSNAFITYEEMHLAGSVYIGLNIEILSACPIPLPPVSEQIAIADFLDEKVSQINALIEKKERLLSELERIKKTLIF